MNIVKYCLLPFAFLTTSAFAASYDANIQFAQKVVLSVSVTGEVATVNVKKGDQFKAGDILLSLNKIPFEASVQEAQARVSKTQALQQEADRDHQHLVELFERGVLSKVELENAELKLQRATADLEAAKSKLTQTKYNLEHSVIAAPFDGLVLDIRVRPHESVNNAVSVMPLITIAERTKYTATTLAPLSAVNKLKINSKAKVSVGNKKYSGTVSGIAYEPSKNGKKENMYEVQVEFKSIGKIIRAGENASVSF